MEESKPTNAKPKRKYVRKQKESKPNDAPVNNPVIPVIIVKFCGIQCRHRNTGGILPLVGSSRYGIELPATNQVRV